MSAEDREMVGTMMVDYDMDLDQLPYTAPPGDEGLDMSHVGGEYEAFEGLAHEVAGISGWYYPNETLIHHGYLGCAPLYPTVTISLCTLAAYRQTHRVCPTFSFQVQCKTLCFLHDIPYRPYLTTQLSGAFDVYLQILQRIDQCLCTALKCNTPNWHLLNACPACFYKLEDEPDLDFDWLDSTIYGMNVRVDSRKVRSDFWIDLNTVDKFNSKVRAHAAMPNQGDDALVDNTAVETNPAPFSCADQWKNAGPEMRKKMFSVFDESGIFIAACRHRFVHLACDMIRSGELAKYPLAIIDKLLAVYGKGGASAYNIWCNSYLGSRAHQLGFHLMVGAFHRHSHNRKCQLDWHPMYIPGTGHSEGEGCEHIFSASNALARGTRHASTFHRHQVIEQHFAFWNDDKYATLSKIFSALKSVQTLTVELSTIKAELDITDDDFPRYILQELPNLHHAEMLVAHVEHQLAVEGRWEIGGDEYNQFKMEACLGKYRTALDDLERLVVMRLFELSKLSLSGTGYKVCQQIGKALQWHSEAIRNAINRYNVQAISWKDIADYSFLGDEDWAKPAHREATMKYFKLCRAHEELTRLNVEIRCLHTAIHTEQVQTTAVIEDLWLSDLKLAEELQRQWCSRAAINAVHLHRLDRIECLAGFSGVRDVGLLIARSTT
ncbi:hypothetical protein EV702DRAFT_1180201 [Suillus placidus]|uniref:CxC2-like cysteine cluster KDZ transposase-associated domain-containing protein n=1 Tax=Suillus placidus TaxID=48579 RepID=A0A9P6ZSP1_9AGAM|nr:hypothetical protein EV702DRAFT_1180201 [Suillus placidus]